VKENTDVINIQLSVPETVLGMANNLGDTVEIIVSCFGIKCRLIDFTTMEFYLQYNNTKINECET
jgi:hypothetical protein